VAAPPIVVTHPSDDVGVVVPDGGLAAGTALGGAFGAGVVLVDDVPQAHKVALRDIPAGAGCGATAW
jgi:galactarate dehydratase